MLFVITSKPEVLKEISNPNELYAFGPIDKNISNKLVNRFTMPTFSLIDKDTYDIADMAVRHMQYHNSKSEENRLIHDNLIAEIKALEEEAEAVSKEDQAKASPLWKQLGEKRSDKTTLAREFFEQYEGVLICEDVPGYMVPQLKSYLQREGWKTYWLWRQPIYETKDYIQDPTSPQGVLLPVDELTGHKPPMIFEMR